MGSISYYPNGNLADAITVQAGDYETFEYVNNLNNLILSDTENDDGKIDIQFEGDEITTLTLENAKKAVALGVRYEDKVLDVQLNERDVYAKVEVGTPKILTKEQSSALTFSEISEILLQCPELNSVTIEFAGIATVKMNASDTEYSLGNLRYFPSEKINNQIPNYY